MLQSKYYTEADLKDFGFKSLGKNVRISSDARIYGQQNIEIGNNVRIDDFAILAAVSGSIKLGNYVFIARNCHLSGTLGIEMHDFSSMAANTVVYSASDDYHGNYLTAQAVPQKYTATVGGPVVIGKHVIIGCASTIIGPSKIGEGCSIGAMTFVHRNLRSWGMYFGIPAQRFRERSQGLLEKEEQLIRELKESSA